MPRGAQHPVDAQPLVANYEKEHDCLRRRDEAKTRVAIQVDPKQIEPRANAMATVSICVTIWFVKRRSYPSLGMVISRSGLQLRLPPRETWTRRPARRCSSSWRNCTVQAQRWS
ncbi:hypothetical protein FOF48_07030 [Corallococcus sp. Z5C101001]|nr:hypothetical protein FOF48_07030 [Corallococcus sp. Z5C101001]